MRKFFRHNGKKYSLEGYAEVKTDTPIVEGDKVVIFMDCYGKIWVRLEKEFNIKFNSTEEIFNGA